MGISKNGKSPIGGDVGGFEMRLIGKRSVAGVVRWLLGLANVFVTIGAVVMVAVAAFSWIIPDFARGFLDGITDRPDGGGIPSGDNLMVSITVTTAALILCLTWLILNRLRRIFSTLTAGDPFQPGNVRWLQTVGAALAGIEVAGLALPLLIPQAVRAEILDGGGLEFDFGTWLGILIVFILAEVFREGARMRDDTQMTV